MFSCTYLYFDLTLTFSSSGGNILEPSYYNIFFFYYSILTFDSCIIPASIPCHVMGQTLVEVVYIFSKCLKQFLLLYSNSLYHYPGPYRHNSLQSHY